MRRYVLIKWAHLLLTLLLLFIIALPYLSSSNKLANDRLIEQHQLDERSTLYITQYTRSGATDGEVYRYYIYTPVKQEPLKELAKQAPFLVADRSDAQISLSYDSISIQYTGRIYSFHNQVFLYSVGKPSV